jgi:hypothetical protein
LALEELLEAEIEDQTSNETVGLVFVERRITAIALHNYFIYRSQEIVRGKWVKARILRKAATRRIPLVSVRNGDQSQFDDSADDPFVAFQQDLEQQLSVPQRNKFPPAKYSPETHQEDQFMDAEDDNFSVALGCDILKSGTSVLVRIPHASSIQFLIHSFTNIL